jgi:hypothetical protein
MMGPAQHDKQKMGGSKFAADPCTPVAPFSSSIRKEFISGTSSPGEVSLLSSRPQHLKRFMVRGAVSAALLATWPSASAHALTWNWSFDGSVQGTFTTAGTTAVANTFQTITAITGTYTYSDGTFDITGLSSSFGATNDFQLDGSDPSPIIVKQDGIPFSLHNGGGINLFRNNPPIPGPLDSIAFQPLPSLSLRPRCCWPACLMPLGSFALAGC